MARGLSLLLLILTLSLIFTRVHCSRVFTSNENKSQGVASTQCVYTVKITTSVRSGPVFKEPISIGFNDWWNAVVKDNINNEPGKMFQPGSKEYDTVLSPCLHEVCAVGLMTGTPSGWIPEKVVVTDHRSLNKFTFFFGFPIRPHGNWHMVGPCHRGVHSKQYDSHFNVSSNYTVD